MGKHERREIELAEKHLVALLNNEQKDYDITKELKQCNVILQKRIKDVFPDIIKATHIGNSYDTIGDVELELNDGEKYLELKYLVSGSGTRANISQDALTKYGIFYSGTGKTISWSDFRKGYGHDKWVEKKLIEVLDNKYSAIPNPRPRICKMAKVLKENLKRKNSNKTKYEKVKNEIMEYDRQKKIEYINYVKTLLINEDNLKKFVLLIMLGRHTGDFFEKFKKNSAEEVFKKIPDNYFVFYVNKNTREIKTLDNTRTKLKTVLENKVIMEFPNNETNTIVCSIINKKKEKLLRIVFLWKNKFQGIETPCLNIFDEEYFGL